jgi:hypothetical protein
VVDVCGSFICARPYVCHLVATTQWRLAAGLFRSRGDAGRKKSERNVSARRALGDRLEDRSLWRLRDRCLDIL